MQGEIQGGPKVWSLFLLAHNFVCSHPISTAIRVIERGYELCIAGKRIKSECSLMAVTS